MIDAQIPAEVAQAARDALEAIGLPAHHSHDVDTIARAIMAHTASLEERIRGLTLERNDALRRAMTAEAQLIIAAPLYSRRLLEAKVKELEAADERVWQFLAESDMGGAYGEWLASRPSPPREG